MFSHHFVPDEGRISAAICVYLPEPLTLLIYRRNASLKHEHLEMNVYLKAWC